MDISLSSTEKLTLGYDKWETAQPLPKALYHMASLSFPPHSPHNGMITTIFFAGIMCIVGHIIIFLDF